METMDKKLLPLASLTARGPKGPPRGRALRQSMRDNAVQDLIYRSEYLATIIGGAFPVAATWPPDEDPRQQLRASCLPRLVDATALILQAGTPTATQRSSAGDGKARAVSPLTHMEHMRLRLNRLGLRGKEAMIDRARPDVQTHAPFSNGPAPYQHADRVRREFGWNAATVGDPGCVADALHGRAVYSDVLSQMRDMVSPHCPAPPQPAPSAGLGNDHHHAAELEIRKHASRCRHVELLDDKWQPDTCGLDFARLFWARAAAVAQGSAGQDVSTSTAAKRWLRADGEDEFSAANRYSLMEQCTVVQRAGSQSPQSASALAIGERPAAPLLQGYYAEVQIVSLSKPADRSDWMRRLEPGDTKTRSRTDGLVFGFTATAAPRPGVCSAMEPAATSLTKLPWSWCIATVGGFYAKGAVESAFTRRQLSWSVALGEGDRLGLLVTSYGGIVLFVNGAHELMIPDAGVRVDVDLYPVVEVSNHIRSVRLMPGASLPP